MIPTGLPVVTVTRYVTPLREGGSLPDPRLQALHAFTRSVILNRGRLPDGEVDRFLDAGFTRAQVLEVLVIIATRFARCRSNQPVASGLLPTGGRWVGGVNPVSSMPRAGSPVSSTRRSRGSA